MRVQSAFETHDGVTNFRGKGFSVESKMIYLADKHGLKTIEVPITEIFVEDGSTLNP